MPENHNRGNVQENKVINHIVGELTEDFRRLNQNGIDGLHE